MKPSEAFMQNRESIARILKRHGLENVRVFGSVIRGEDREDSDLDLLAGGNFHQCFQAEIALERFLNVRVNVIARDSLYKPFEVCTLADAVPLLDAFPGARPPRGEMFVRAKDIFRLKWILQGLDRIRTSTKNKTEQEAMILSFPIHEIESRLSMLSRPVRNRLDPEEEIFGPMGAFLTQEDCRAGKKFPRLEERCREILNELEREYVPSPEYATDPEPEV